MKKSFTLLAGVVLLLAIPFAACHNKGKKAEIIAADHKSRNVTIELTSVVEIKGVYHLMMNDSINSGIDTTFITDVYRGKTVKWIKSNNSGIEKIVKVKGHRNHFIFKKNPSELINSDGFEMVIPDDAENCMMEEYLIEFKLKKDHLNYISDPYLRIPPED